MKLLFGHQLNIFVSSDINKKSFLTGCRDQAIVLAAAH